MNAFRSHLKRLDLKTETILFALNENHSIKTKSRPMNSAFWSEKNDASISNIGTVIPHCFISLFDVPIFGQNLILIENTSTLPLCNYCKHINKFFYLYLLININNNYVNSNKHLNKHKFTILFLLLSPIQTCEEVRDIRKIDLVQFMQFTCK